jgi:hypothetical protein
VAAIALAFVVTSRLTALLAARAAAGVAFRKVILAMAGYFTMVRPNGIGVGDRVSLQGPVRDAHGEAPEFGTVGRGWRYSRIRSSGRVGPCFPPNSVVFIGSFIKPVSGAVAVAHATS